MFSLHIPRFRPALETRSCEMAALRKCPLKIAQLEENYVIHACSDYLDKALWCEELILFISISI